jgi:AraC-like DNA-binding protein
MYSTKIVDAMDPDVLVASGRPFNLRLTVTERGTFRTRSRLIDMERVWAQRNLDRVAWVKHIDLSRSGIIFLTEPGPSMFVNGAEVGIDQVMIAQAGASCTYRLSGPTQWGAMSLAKEDIDDLFSAHWLGGVAVLTPPPRALARLRLLHGYLDCLPEMSLEAPANTQFARDLEARLVAGLRGVTDSQTSTPYTVARGRHHIIVNRFRAIVEEQAYQPLYMSEISQSVGISGRTLRLACQEQLGVSPHQYVMLHRLQSARRALQKADPAITRVTEIATEHGFWELGRFAVTYRHLFGEAPSTTLRAAA